MDKDVEGDGCFGILLEPKNCTIERNTGNQEFLLGSIDKKENTIKCLDLDDGDGEICDVSCSLWLLF